MRAFVLALVLALSASAAFAVDKQGGSGEATIRATLVKRAELGFPPGVTGIPAVVRPRLDQLAHELKRAIVRENATLEVEAYAREPMARTVALQRVVDVRGALVDRGVPAERINVRVLARDSQGRLIPNLVVIWYRRPPIPSPRAPIP